VAQNLHYAISVLLNLQYGFQQKGSFFRGVNMKKDFLLIKIIFIIFIFAASAQATPMLSIVDDPGSDGSIPVGASNELLSPIYGSGTTSRDGYYGSTVKLTESALVTFTFLGFEAGFDNDFNLNVTELFSTEDYGSNLVTGISVMEGPFLLPAGIISFSFDINNNSGSVANGSNPDDSKGEGDINFFTSFDNDPTAMLGTSLVVFLDDSGAGPDNDHDDFGVRIQAAPVPEPATMILVGAGLIGLAGFRRRRRK